jgi:hypothetical protein
MATVTKTKKGGPKVVGTRRVRERDVDPAELAKVEAAVQGEEFDPDNDELIMAVCRHGAFQISPAFEEPINVGGAYRVKRHQGRTLDFGVDLRLVIDEETADIIDSINAGTFDNGFVDPKYMRQLAQEAGLQVIRPTLVGPPMATWDSTPADRVVEVAKAAGLLDSERALQDAIRYERQRPIREKHSPKPGKPRADVIRELEFELAKIAGPVGTADDLDGVVEEL